MALNVSIPVTRVRQTGKKLSLIVTGLSGGHSGSEIDKEHGNADWKNIDDDPNNDINHDDVIRIKDGTEEVSFEEEAKKAKVSVEEFKRIYEEQSESLTPEQRIENVHEEIEEQYMGNDERRR